MTLMSVQPLGWDADSLFARIFLPLYPPEAQRDPSSARSTVICPANDCETTELIEEIAEAFKYLAPSLLGLAHQALDDTDASVERLSAAMTRTRRDQLIHERTVGTSRTPLLAMIAIHGTLYLGRCVVRNHAGQWVLRNPIWESTVLVGGATRAPTELALFQWWLCSLSDDEIDCNMLGRRYREAVGL